MTFLGKIAIRNGRVYFAHTMPSHKEGINLTTFHLIDASPDHVADGWEATFPAFYRVRAMDPKTWRWYDFATLTPDGLSRTDGSTVPAFSEESPCPRPRTKAELRWSTLRGWQKWNKKTREWENA